MNGHPHVCTFLGLLFLCIAVTEADAATPAVSVGSVHGLALKSDGTVWAWGANADGQLGDGTNLQRITPVQAIGLSSIDAIDAGFNHSVALSSDGTVWVWGRNSEAQLGDGATTDRNIAFQLAALTNVSAIAAGDFHTLVLKNDSTVWSWGTNSSGQLGDGTTTQRLTPVQITSLTNVVAIAAGDLHSLAVKSDGSVWAWGSNGNGRLGDGTTTQRSTPVQVFALTDVVSIGAGSEHSAAVTADGKAWSWGANSDGRLGDGSNIQSTTPARVSNLTDAVHAVAGPTQTLVIRGNGTALGWGGNSFGQVGDGTNASHDTPTTVLNLTNVVSIAAGLEHSAAVTSDGGIWGWGRNNQGQLGDGTFGSRFSAVRVVGVGGMGTFDAGAVPNSAPVIFTDHYTVFGTTPIASNLRGGDADGDAVTYTLVALPTQGVVTLVDASTGAFGYTANMGASGTDTFTFKVNDGSVDSAVAVVTVRFASLGIVPGIAVGVSHSVALQTDGTLWSWGINSNGELGDGSLVRRLTPVRVRAFDGTVFDEGVSVVAGGNHTLVERGDGTWWGWGSNLYGQLGDGTTVTPRLTPVQVSVVPSLATLMGGVIHTAALKTDGTVWGWGRNNQGQLGDGTTTQRSTPVQVSGLSGVVQIALSVDGSHTVALRNDGTVWTWGFNSNGQLGDGTATSRSLPVQVRKVDGTVLDGVVSVAAGSGHTVALGGDGRVWAWGLDNAGQLGNAQSNSTTPVLVLHTDGTVFQGVVSIEAFGLTSLAVTADGTRWGWGGGSSGELGNGVFANNAHPVVLPALVDIAALVHGSTHTLARTAGGELRTWGINSNGQLGDGTVVARAAAVAVVGSGG